MYSVDEDDEGVDLDMIKNWFTTVTNPREESTNPVSGVTLDKTELVLTVGETATLTPTIVPENATNKNYSFKSNDTSIATVTPVQGKVTAVAAGTTTVVVTTEDGNHTAECSVTVNA